ncbi:MAG: M43 family zinc metalloprotease [Sporocytophaga sp.]|nr:M43 family zinc metalloprotease [Sporocytophaga sp.]
MKKLFLLLAFLLAGFNEAFINPSFSKSISGDTIKPLTKVDKEFLIVAHIVKDQEGNAGITPFEISSVLAQVNTLFTPIGMSFTLCQTDYIDNFQYDSLNGIGPSVQNLKVDYMKEVAAQYNIERRINMYFMSEFINAYKPYCGFAGDYIVIKKGCNTQIVVAHEFGHYFGLLHTFAGNGTELADGSNCNDAGDKVCDTPADPFNESSPDSYYDKSSCQFIYRGRDANNQFYSPDLGNIMSYYTSCVCPKFSHGQLEKMARYYNKLIINTPEEYLPW